VYGWTEDPSQAWLARSGDGPADGWYRLSLPERENRWQARVELVVHPARRRNGLGRALLTHAAGQARAAGRTLLTAETAQGSAGDGFARALGARQGLTEVDRVLRVDAQLPGRLAVLRQQAEPAADGYKLVSWSGPTPEERLEEVAGINAAMADAPMDQGREPDRWDAGRVRASDARTMAQGMRRHTVAAEDQDDGRLVALTQLSVDPGVSEWGFQEMTAVARPHRGHRLGLLVKVAMLEGVAGAEPQLTRILTGNADTNAHMIAINEQLGFEVAGSWSAWELEASSLAC
jgi:GNAT superfamily N-acetyltransferase